MFVYVIRSESANNLKKCRPINNHYYVVPGKKNPKWPTQKTMFFKIANSQYFFVKIFWIGPWVSRIDDAKGIDVAQPMWRLSDISSKMA